MGNTLLKALQKSFFPLKGNVATVANVANLTTVAIIAKTSWMYNTIIPYHTIPYSTIRTFGPESEDAPHFIPLSSGFGLAMCPNGKTPPVAPHQPSAVDGLTTLGVADWAKIALA